MLSRGRFVTLMLVLAAHGLLALAIDRFTAWPWRSAAPVAPDPVTVRLLDDAPSVERQQPQLPPGRPVAPTAPLMPWPDVVVVPAAEVGSPTIARTPAPPASQAATADRPSLDLRTPRLVMQPPGARQQALDDPRANSPRATVESRIADALGGTGALTVEDLGDGRRKLRQGGRCVEVHDARIAALNPFDESMRPSPKQAMRCR